MSKTSPVRSESVITTAFQRLRDDILHGRYHAGQKLPGERDLCQAYGIGRSSMRQVLLKLQEERYIERKPMSGTYIREDLDSHVQIITLAFVSPDASFDPEQIGISGWSSITEIMRGMYEEASVHPGVLVTVLHCEDTSNPDKLHHQLENLRRFDGVVFCGYLMQPLKALYAKEGKPAMVVAPKLEVIPERFPTVSFDYAEGIQDLLSVAIQRHKDVVLFYHAPHFVDAKEHDGIIATLQSQLKNRGVPCESRAFELEEDESGYLHCLQQVCGNFSQLKGKLIWVLNRAMLQPMNHLILKNGIDAELIGFSTSMVLQEFYPKIHYLLVPFYETGRAAVRNLVKACQQADTVASVTLKPALYFGGKKIDNH